MDILFVCTGNTCRSPMAQGMLEKILEYKKGAYSVDSAGIYVHPGSKITEQAKKQLEARGVDMGARKSVGITHDSMEKADLVFTMTDNQRRMLVETFPYAAEKIHLLGDYTNRGGDVADPYGGDDEAYARTAGGNRGYARHIGRDDMTHISESIQ